MKIYVKYLKYLFLFQSLLLILKIKLCETFWNFSVKLIPSFNNKSVIYLTKKISNLEGNFYKWVFWSL